MSILKNYISKKELINRLNIQMDNNKMINNQNIFLAKETIKYQNEIKNYKLEIARLIVMVEDLTGFREQDKECIKALKKERQSLKTKLTKLEKQIDMPKVIYSGKMTNSEIEQIKDYKSPIMLLKDESKVEVLKSNKRGKKDGK